MGLNQIAEERLQLIFNDNLENASSKLSNFMRSLEVPLNLNEIKVPVQEWNNIVDEAFLGERGKNFIGNKESFTKSLLGATKTSCMIAFILAGSSFLTLAMAFTGLPKNLAVFIDTLQLSPYMLLLVLTLFYIILGMFLDGISAVVLTMAIIEPMIRQAGFDMIWFGVYLVIVVEMAQITPPVGFNLFVLQGMAKRDMGFIARSAFPLFLLMILAVIIIIAFPQLALWLPEQMIQPLK